jgi:hypothetical protein
VTVLRPRALIQTLAEFDVQFVIVGGIAAAMHGIPNETPDLDIVCPRTDDNNRLLLQALSALDARVKGAVDTAPPLSPALLDERIVTFSTDAGELDIIFEAKGGYAFDDLMPSAVSVKVGETEVLLVAAPDLVAMKRATNRPKDQVTLLGLEALEAVESAKAVQLPDDPETTQIRLEDWLPDTHGPRKP